MLDAGVALSGRAAAFLLCLLEAGLLGDELLLLLAKRAVLCPAGGWILPGPADVSSPQGLSLSGHLLGGKGNKEASPGPVWWEKRSRCPMLPTGWGFPCFVLGAVTAKPSSTGSARPVPSPARAVSAAGDTSRNRRRMVRGQASSTCGLARRQHLASPRAARPLRVGGWHAWRCRAWTPGAASAEQ